METEIGTLTMVDKSLFYNKKHRCYSMLIDSSANDVQIWTLLLKYTRVIREKEGEDVLVRATDSLCNGMCGVFFCVNSIGVEELSLIKELYPNETSNGFSVVGYKDNVVVITQNGNIISGSDMINKLIFGRSESDRFIMRGSCLSDLFFTGMVQSAISTEVFFRPAAEELRAKRVETEEQHTYLLLDKNSLLTKVGRTADIMRRMSEFSNSNTNLIWIAECKGGKYETEIHRKYKDKLVLKEWYKLTIEDIDNIIEKYRMKTTIAKWKKFFTNRSLTK